MIDLKEVSTEYPRTMMTPWLELKLSDDVMKHLWKSIEEGEKKPQCMKNSLAGNLSTSFALNDEDNYFTTEVLLPLAEHYNSMIPDSTRDVLEPSHGCDTNGRPLQAIGTTLFLRSLWANYQYKHEFNPVHDHGGAFSFVIWMKIPYNYEEQKKLKFLDGVRLKTPGNFYFEYLNMLGKISNSFYNMSPEYEGTMLFFPAKLRHGVHPFYECDEKRISISGNLDFVFQYDKVRGLDITS
tara:strand:+ start:465 stop:1181 length:717 start_codon:yes stop_codon:yes gene_type:complete